jgi:ketosteroid isomerase-like protein
VATSPENVIRARRRLTNKLIAAHDAERLRPFYASDTNVIVGDGSLIVGREAVLDAFKAQFSDPAFQTFVREAETVTLDAEGLRAAESGSWTGVWRNHQMHGSYLAVWRKMTGQWVIESEIFVTLR